MKNLETERLLLRKVNLEDLDQIYTNWASDKITNEYLTFSCHENKEQTKKLIDFWQRKYEKNGYEWCIEIKDTHQIIGMISGEKSYKYKCVEIGYSISSSFFNKGYTTEAVQKVIDYFLKECDFHIVEAIIPSKNVGSIRVAEKCNMKKEATLKARYKNKITNKINDLYVYSIFNKNEEEWK